MRARRILGGVSLTPVLVVGCGQVLGLDGDSVVRGPGVDAAVPAPNPTGTKECDGKQVPLDDPRFGCAGATCEPCSIPFASDVKCVAGQCTLTTCRADRADCNGRSDDGCEVDLTAAPTCGSCSTSCGGGTPFCAKEGGTIRCVATCSAGLVPCGSACVDTKNSPEHCSACERRCQGTATTDPVCNGGNCGVVCRAGLEPCEGGDPAKGCGTLTTYYEDIDQDQHGNPAITKQACALPSGFARAGDDCHDGNAEVFPGQTMFFPTRYARQGGGFSYDYDCNGHEVEAPGFVHFNGSACNVPSGCSGGGYATSLSRGEDDNPYCGSSTIQTCTPSSSGGTSCSSQSTSTTNRITCH